MKNPDCEPPQGHVPKHSPCLSVDSSIGLRITVNYASEIHDVDCTNKSYLQQLLPGSLLGHEWQEIGCVRHNHAIGLPSVCTDTPRWRASGFAINGCLIGSDLQISYDP